MQAKSHIVLGALAWGVTAVLVEQDWLLQPELWVLAVIGSLLPDIDHPQSTIGRRLRFISVPISRFLGHRTITHSLLVMLGWALLYQAFPDYQMYLLALIVGYASHLAADFLTKSGIPLFYPIKISYRFWFAVKTGGKGESVFVVLLVALGFGVIFNAMGGVWPTI